MQYRNPGRTGIKVSPYGRGALMFATRVGNPDPEDSIRIIHKALAAGINLVDTADAYGDSEEVVGRALKGRRDHVVLTTKVSRPKRHDMRDGATGAGEACTGAGAGPPVRPTLHRNMFRWEVADVETPDPSDHAAQSNRTQRMGDGVPGADALQDRVGGDSVCQRQDPLGFLRRHAEVEQAAEGLLVGGHLGGHAAGFGSSAGGGVDQHGFLDSAEGVQEGFDG